MERSKNFLEFSVFAAGRLRIWLIFGWLTAQRQSFVWLQNIFRKNFPFFPFFA